jgi:hypothetical protein
MSSYVEAPKKKKTPRGVPILGLVLAIALAAFAYGISLPLVDFGEGQSDKVKSQFDDLRAEFQKYKWYQDSEKYHGNNIVEIIIAAVLWFVMMGIAMFIVSATLVGTDPDKASWKDLPPSRADRKAMVKQLKKDLKETKQQLRDIEKKK